MLRLVLCSIAVVFSFGCPFAQDNEVGLLIQYARIVDGTGSPWFCSDVAIDYGYIVGVGFDLKVKVRRTIDAVQSQGMVQ